MLNSDTVLLVFHVASGFEVSELVELLYMRLESDDTADSATVKEVCCYWRDDYQLHVIGLDYVSLEVLDCLNLMAQVGLSLCTARSTTPNAVKPTEVPPFDREEQRP